jgi:hypothetical protein
VCTYGVEANINDTSILRSKLCYWKSIPKYNMCCIYIHGELKRMNVCVCVCVYVVWYMLYWCWYINIWLLILMVIIKIKMYWKITSSCKYITNHEKIQNIDTKVFLSNKLILFFCVVKMKMKRNLFFLIKKSWDFFFVCRLSAPQ